MTDELRREPRIERFIAWGESRSLTTRRVCATLFVAVMTGVLVTIALLGHAKIIFAVVVINLAVSEWRRRHRPNARGSRRLP